jgi:hypothetical protein
MVSVPGLGTDSRGRVSQRKCAPEQSGHLATAQELDQKIDPLTSASHIRIGTGHAVLNVGSK